MQRLGVAPSPLAALCLRFQTRGRVELQMQQQRRRRLRAPRHVLYGIYSGLWKCFVRRGAIQYSAPTTRLPIPIDFTFTNKQLHLFFSVNELLSEGESIIRVDGTEVSFAWLCFALLRSRLRVQSRPSELESLSELKSE